MLRTKKEVDRHVRELLVKIKNENDRKSRGYNIARLYYNVSEYESARRYLAEYIALRPKSPEAHKLMAQIYEKLGQKVKALQSYKISYEISDTQKDIVLRICELYVDSDADTEMRTYWAEEGERLFPHHNSVVRLRQSLMLANPSQSKGELEAFYMKEIQANPLCLSLHVKLAKLLVDWGKEDNKKLEEAFNYVVKVEARRPFPHSLEWYQTMVDAFKAYESWKKPKSDKHFEELYLSILDRYVFESLASCCGPPLCALCSPKEASQRLRCFDKRITMALKLLGKKSSCLRHMTAQYYFHLALLIAILGKAESILQKDIYLGCLLLHTSYLPNKEADATTTYVDKSDLIKGHWVSLAHYRVSHSGHMLNQLAHAYRGGKNYLNKVQEICGSEAARKHIFSLAFEATSDPQSSVLLSDETFMKGNLSFIDPKVQSFCDRDVCMSCSDDLRELVWLYQQHTSPGYSKGSKFFNFHFFRSIPFASSMHTCAPETLCHLDLVAFIVATDYCHQSNTPLYGEVTTSRPSIMASSLYTPEQGEWWNAAASLCSNAGSKRLNRLRSILQNGLESIRHLAGHHVLPLQLTLHLARYFTTCISEAREEGNSPTDIESLEERAEIYWSKVSAQCTKTAKGTFCSLSTSRLFELRRCQLSDNELDEIREEGDLFIADRMTAKGNREEAIGILSRLKSPKAAFNCAMLYKKESQNLLGNRTWHSLNLNARQDYISLLTKTRNALYLTLDRLKMPGVDPSDPLNVKLSEELTNVEHSLTTVTLEDGEEHSDNGLSDCSPNNFSPSLDLTNGNSSGINKFSSHLGNLTASNFSTPVAANRSHRQEARPSPERLDAQVRHLTDIQLNTIKNIEEHNAALRAQNKALLHTCQTMASEFKENVAFYKSYIEQKNTAAEHIITPIMDEMKQLQTALKNLQIEVRTVSSELNELRNIRASQTKPEPLQLVTGSTAGPDTQVAVDLASPAIQGVYNNYMSFYGQQPVGSPLVPPTAIFNPCQPPFMPPSTIQDQTYLASTASTIARSDSGAAPMTPASTLYQQNLKTTQARSSKESPETTGPPHSYQISLPTTSTVPYLSMPQTDDSLSGNADIVFNTEGLLSNIPAPLYSAVSSTPSPEKGSTKNILVSSLTSTPISRNPSSSLDTSVTTPIFGQWPSSNANFPPAPSSMNAVVPSSDGRKASPPKAANDSEHYEDDGHDPCPDFKPIIPLPAQVEVHTGEEEEKVLFEDRAKLFRFHEKELKYGGCEKEWKERGLGPLKILHNEKQGTVRVLMRREMTHKICCNHLITPNMELNSMAGNDKVWLWAAQDFADEKITSEKFCCKFKTPEVMQAFQKAFYKGRSIVEEVEKSKKETLVEENDAEVSTSTPQESKPSSLKPLSEMFKPDPGSWSCTTCLVSNKKDSVTCVSCQSLKPGATKSESTEATTTTSEDSKVTFKFGFQPSVVSSASVEEPVTTLTFMSNKVTSPSSLVQGTSSPTTTTKPAIKFGVSTGSPSVSASPIFGTGTSSVAFGSNSSITITPIKPGATPSISLFKGNTSSPSALVFSGDQPPTTTTTTIIIPSKDEESGKFSVEGFTFSSVPNLVPPKSAEEPSSEKPLDKAEPKKESIFSNFTFSPPKSTSDAPSKGLFTFSLPTTTSSSTSATTTTSSGTSGGGLFSASQQGNTMTFSSLKQPEKPIFVSKDPDVFKPKPLFTKSSNSKASGEGNTSKDEVEDYEPQVDFKPVVPLPDLVDVKTGEEEEEKMFCERAKLYRYDGEAKEWKERGVGEVKLLNKKALNKVRLLMRRDQTFKVCANHLITPDMTLSANKDSDKAWVWGANDYADEELKIEKFAIRFKTVELAQKFRSAFEDAQKLVAEAPSKPETTAKPSSGAEKEKSQTTAQPLSELFKPSAGSWECATCLVVNEAENSACLACATPKGGEGAGKPPSSTSEASASQFAKQFSFKSLQEKSGTSAFSFGVPTSTSTTSPATTSGSSSTFSFGLGTSTSTFQTTTTSVSSTSSVKLPYSFTWKPPGKESSPEVSAPVPEQNGMSTPTKTNGKPTGFAFGSPGKYEFTFSGVRSPRSRDTSTCESENGVEEEEEEDSLYFEPVIPLPEKVEVVTGEEEELVLFCHRAKLYRLHEGEFKDRGLGDVKILEHKKTGKIRLLMRREQVHKICLNHYLTKELEFRKKDDKSLYWVATDFSELKPAKETFAIRFKSPDVANAFLDALKDAQARLTLPLSDRSPLDLRTFPTTKISESPLGEGAETSPSDDIEIVYERKVKPDLIERARKLKLPDNFYAFEDKDFVSCVGCWGCESENIIFKALPSPVTFDDCAKYKLPAGDIFLTPGKTPDSKSIFHTPTSNLSFGNTFTPPANNSIFGSKWGTSFSGNTPKEGNVSSTSIFGGAPASTSIFGGTPSGRSIFGGTPSTTTPSLFGTPTTTTSSIFGGTPATTTSSIFGGTPATTTSSIFGGTPATTTPSIFGGTPATTTPSIFGGTPATTTPSIFGTVNSSSSLFSKGTPTTSQSLFGAPPTTTKSLFGGAPSATQSLFGGTTSTTQSIFGAPPSTTHSAGLFGSTPSNNKSHFGSAPTTQSPFASTPSTTQSLFGSIPSGHKVTFGESSTPVSLFGNTKTKTLFGETSSNTSDSSQSITDPSPKVEVPKTGILLGNQAENISFGDLAKNSSTPNFTKTGSKDPSAWVTKPLFASKSPSADNSNTSAGEEGYDPHYEPVIPLPELVQVTTGEEGWEEFFSKRAKVYRYDPNGKEWKERGIGDFKIQFEPNLNKFRLLQRREQVHKLSCNHYLTPKLCLDPMISSENAWCWLATDYSEKPEGEAMKLAVKFKTKEIALDFKAKFEECQKKLECESSSGAETGFSIIPPNSSQPSGSVEEESSSPQVEEQNEDDDDYEDVSESDENEVDEEEIEDEEEDQEDFFYDKCDLFMKSKKSWRSLGAGELRVKYDGDAYGSRILGTSEGGEKLFDNLISIQTTLHVQDEKTVTWTSIDESGDKPRKVELKAVFKTKESANNFTSAFEEGKDCAFSSAIEDAHQNEVPKEMLYYGQANED